MSENLLWIMMLWNAKQKLFNEICERGAVCLEQVTSAAVFKSQIKSRLMVGLMSLLI